MAVWTLVFFAGNVVLFWYGFRVRIRCRLLPAVFYLWVNCFGIIAPVQAWSFANSLFDTRQAKRLFGLVGAGASLGAIWAACWRACWSGRSAGRSTSCWSWPR